MKRRLQQMQSPQSPQQQQQKQLRRLLAQMQLQPPQQGQPPLAMQPPPTSYNQPAKQPEAPIKRADEFQISEADTNTEMK